jgi:hypothetical protein
MKSFFPIVFFWFLSTANVHGDAFYANERVYLNGVYSGEVSFGFPHGYGAYVYWGGDKYVGEFKNNKLHGSGVLHFSNGEQYVGLFKSDKRHGQGTYTFANGDVYVGGWRIDKYISETEHHE